jgi:hypothetical protein
VLFWKIYFFGFDNGFVEKYFNALQNSSGLSTDVFLLPFHPGDTVYPKIKTPKTWTLQAWGD